MASKDRLRERKKRLAQKTSPFDPQDACLLSPLGKIKVALPLQEARAVISLNPEAGLNCFQCGIEKCGIEKPFFLPTSFFGLVSFEGAVVHLLDLPGLLNQTPPSPPLFAMVWNTSPLLYGIPLYSEGEKIFLPPAKLLGTEETEEVFLKGRITWEGQEVLVVDSQKLIDFVERR